MLRSNLAFFNQEVDIKKHIEKACFPYLPHKVKSAWLNEAGRRVSDQEAQNAVNYFQLHPQVNRYILMAEGKKFCTILRLTHPTTQRDVFFSIFPGKKHGTDLGHGAYGGVQIMQNIHSGDFYALKTFKYPINRPAQANLTKEQAAQLEFDNLKLLGLTCGAIDTPCKDGVHRKSLVSMEIVPGINLQEYILQKPNISSIKWLQIGISILKAIQKLHQNGYLHRDLKPENIILDLRTFTVRLIDYGFMSHTLESKNGTWGTPNYIPLASLQYRNHDVRSDIFSAGKILLELPLWQSIAEGKLKAKLLAFVKTIASEDKDRIPTLAQAINFLTDQLNEFPQVLDKVMKIGIVSIPEFLALSSTTNYYHAMQQMDVIWFIDNIKSSNKTYMEIQELLRNYKINCGDKLFLVKNPHITAAQVTAQLGEINPELRPGQHSLFLISESTPKDRNTENFTVLDPTQSLKTLQETIRASLYESHLVMDQYRFVKRTFMTCLNHYRDAAADSNHPKLQKKNYLYRKFFRSIESIKPTESVISRCIDT